MAQRFFDSPTGKANGMPAMLKAKMFGLPRWAWLAVLAGGLTIGLVMRARANAAAEEEPTSGGDPAAAVETEDQFGYAPDTGYDTGMTLSPAAEGGYYGYPDANNDLVEATPDGPYYDNSVTKTYKVAGKGNKVNVRGDDNRTGAGGGGSKSGHTGGHGRKRKPKSKHKMTGGGPPKNRRNHHKPKKKK